MRYADDIATIFTRDANVVKPGDLLDVFNGLHRVLMVSDDGKIYVQRVSRIMRALYWLRWLVRRAA